MVGLVLESAYKQYQTKHETKSCPTGLQGDTQEPAGSLDILYSLCQTGSQYSPCQTGSQSTTHQTHTPLQVWV